MNKIKKEPKFRNTSPNKPGFMDILSNPQILFATNKAPGAVCNSNKDNKPNKKGLINVMPFKLNNSNK